MLLARDNSTQPGAASSRMNTITSSNEFLQALVAKPLYEELASGDLLWYVVGYLRGFENKLRISQTYWGVPLMEDASGGAESLKLTIPKYVMDRAGANAGDCLRARGMLRVSKQFRSSAFEVYLSVTELRRLGATGNPERTPPGSIHLADAEVGCCESQSIS